MLKKGLMFGVLACGVGLSLMALGLRKLCGKIEKKYYDDHMKGPKKWSRGSEKR